MQKEKYISFTRVLNGYDYVIGYLRRITMNALTVERKEDTQELS